MSLVFYAMKIMIIVAGFIYGGHLMYVPEQWVAIGAIVLLGFGFLLASKRPVRSMHRRRVLARHLARHRF